MGAKRELIGSRCSVDIRSLTRAGLRQPGDSLTMKWHSSHQGKLPGSAMVTMLDVERLHIIHFESDIPAEILDLTHTATAFGGQRVWFQCSKLGCGRRVAVLHATPKGFRCRHCTHLFYGSPFEQPYDRLLRSTRRIRQRLGCGINLLEAFPTKPKGMHWATYLALMEQESRVWLQIGERAASNRRLPA
jgi:hypothetical protein